MLKSLQARILVSHLAIILLVFSLTFAVAFFPIRREQTRLEIQRLEDVAAPVAVQAGFVLGRPALQTVADEILDAQARQLNVRLLLLDRSGTVLHDTETSQPLPPQITSRVGHAIATLDQRAGQAGTPNRLGKAERNFYLGTIGNDRVVLTLLTQVDGRYIAVLSPRGTGVLRGLFVPLLLALAIGLIGAFIATLFLSRSIALPISRLTDAADAVATGDLNRTVPGQGDDEVGRLVASFNQMVSRLHITYESQRRLLANIAHELRTPLTSIQGYAQGLSDGVFVTEQQRQEALDTIGQESERVNELLMQILELARLESGQSGPQVREADIDDIVSRILRRHRVEADNNGIDLAGPPSGALRISCDEGLIDQAIDNLVRNAIRHTPSGGKVEVSILRTADATRTPPGIRIRVSDTGDGIPAEALPHIFDRFYRVGGNETNETSNNHGFGLGLAIVREIALTHGGSVSVESDLGRGTTFILDLPGLIRDAQPKSASSTNEDIDPSTGVNVAYRS